MRTLSLEATYIQYFSKNTPWIYSPSPVFTEPRVTKLNRSAISQAAINTRQSRAPRLTLRASVGSLLQLGDEPRALFTPDRLDLPAFALETI
jgi:hypothetical protein